MEFFEETDLVIFGRFSTTPPLNTRRQHVIFFPDYNPRIPYRPQPSGFATISNTTDPTTISVSEKQLEEVEVELVADSYGKDKQ